MGLNGLKSFDFYRKIERDFTKGTFGGALLSICGTILMVALFLLELNDYLSTEVSTQITIDEFEDSTLKINFDITVERLACPFVSIDTENVLGTHKLNLTRNIRKWKVKTKGTVQRRIKETEPAISKLTVQTRAKPVPDHIEPDVLTPSNFEEYVKNHDVVMVEFFAPWCVWSQRFAPIWRQTAHDLRKKYKGRVGIAQCDCTAEDQTRLCHMNHVDRFPTIISYKNGNTHTHDVFHGDRTVDSFSEHVNLQLQTLQQQPESEAERDVLKVEEEDYLDGDGHHLPAVEGCHVSGYVVVQKVPGSLIVSAVSSQHSFDTKRVNMSHRVHHLSFGQKFADDELEVLPDEVTDSLDKLKDREYVSRGENQTHEHYIKVVGTTFKYLDVGTLSSYKYTSHSATYHANTKLPVIRFHYDISPMNVVITESYKPLYQFVTSMFAIIGGVFTVFGLMDGVVYNTQTLLLKRKIELGKQR
mmetsp:Transcript_10192/g.11739  ORF Transcript_10192/g.11739 Transcript_10192/m.11739 type:complete len:472 (+) Transcript_10192:157-1572(+)|eukprot:CAMPEP_0184008642 /NCGR_PEP_ID=MMETSP0954-20121128/2097_1 /TAXON_ID=627963 /ORGANISM="Aplanochytrium sp, Strain PBS07" /LENGTH=471 /DNA_ID=CAMNT_0026287795 /DNA_START=171 /DNA_END=1586 /DNA_ORIENTATION=+